VSQHRLVRALTVIPPRVRRIGAPVLAAAILVGGGFGIMHGHHATPTPTAVRTDDRASRDEARTAASPDPTTPAPTTPAAPPAPSTPAAPTTTTTRPKATTAAPAPAPPAPLAAGCSAYSGNRLVACNLLPSFGFSTGEMASLDPLWQHESGWSTSAANSSGAYGIPQALPGSKMASAGSDWQTSAATQISWGLSYIKGRYGSPSAAWSYWLSHNWY
jgi:colicin import membrane protein